MPILIVEDEPKAGDYLRKGLMESGYVADLARNGPDGLNLALERDYELIVLDVMLPQMDGWTVLQKLRERKDTPVLFLTARDDVIDRVKGLELGADDYLVKPFAFAELLARVKTLMRRGPVREMELIRIADLEIDVLRRRVTRHGDLLSRTQIASMVWDMNFDSDTNVVDVAIRRLRAKVDDPYADKLVQTVRGMGYLLELRP